VTATDKAGNVAVVMRSYYVHYAFTGFYSPVTNPSTQKLNLVLAGDMIQLSFGLAGDRGLDVFAAGSPSPGSISCPAWTPHSVKAAPAGSTAGLSFGAASNHYRFGLAVRRWLGRHLPPLHAVPERRQRTAHGGLQLLPVIDLPPGSGRRRSPRTPNRGLTPTARTGSDLGRAGIRRGGKTVSHRQCGSERRRP
jgi:hypothetical protein